MKYTPRPTLFAAAVDLVPHLSETPLAELSDDQLRALAKKAVHIARIIGDELSEGAWAPTVAAMPTLANVEHTVPDRPDGTRPEWIRLPPPKSKCKFTGLSRSSLYQLVGHIEGNGFKPPVKSIVIRKRGAARGVRLISYDSLMAYLASVGHGPAIAP